MRWRLLAIAVALLATSAVRAQDAQADLSGKLAVIAEGVSGNQEVGAPVYGLWVTDGLPGGNLLWTLVFDPSVPPLENPKTGDQVFVTVDLARSGAVPGLAGSGGGAPGSLHVLWLQPAAFGSSPDPAYYDGANPMALRSITFVASSVCGAKAGMSAQDVRTAYFGSAGGGLRGASRPPSTSITLEWLWERCAYNAITFKSAHNLVVNVSLPCAGTRDNGAPFNGAAACGTNELLGWSEAAAAAARALNVDVSQYPRRVLVLPAGGGALPRCSWSRRGSLGCDVDRGCDAWVRGDSPNLVELVMAEQGRSLLLANSAGPRPAGGTAPAADATCAMGSTQGQGRCFNSLNSWKLGVVTPTRTLEATPVGYHIKVNLTAPSSSSNLLRILPYWAPGYPSASDWYSPRPQFAVQYRPPLEGDTGLAPGVAGRLALHVANWAPQPEQVPAEPTRLLTTLAAGQSYRSADYKFVVKFLRVLRLSAADAGGVMGLRAEVDVCRPSVERESEGGEGACENGADDDCDGLVDSADPDCAARK